MCIGAPEQPENCILGRPPGDGPIRPEEEQRCRARRRYGKGGARLVDPVGEYQHRAVARDPDCGARIAVGAASFQITAVIKSEPDKLASGIAFGPRMIVSEAALRATGLLQPGSLVRWHYRLRLPDGSDRAADTVVSDATAQLPDAGWQARTRTNASPSLERNVERFTQFLTLVGLTALLIGGVGVANAVKSHIDRKRDVIATLKDRKSVV